MIKFSCSKCGQSIRVDDKYAGKSGRCPRCGTAVEVPAESSIITFRCGSCGTKIKVSSRHTGRRGQCPTCQEAVVIPGGKMAPPEESPAPAISCSMCGQTIEMAGHTPVPFVECPACGSRPEGVEELRTEPAAASAMPARSNRRRLIVIIGVLAVATAAHIGLVLFLRSRDSSPVRESPIRHRQDEVAEMGSSAESAAGEVAPSEQIASPEIVLSPSAETIHLRFHPRPGVGPTLCVTTRLDISSQEAGQQVELASTQSFTVALEAKRARPDGAVPVVVTLRAIRVRTQMGGTVLGEYDSDKPLSETDSMAGIYVPFVGKRFTIHVSDQGELLDPGFDELFLGVAADRVEVEDDMMREQLKERAEEAIATTDQRYGSRRSRTLALKQQFEESYVFGTDAIRGLLDHLIVRLPDEPVQSGSRWDGPIPLRLEARFEIPGTYAIAVLEDDSCKIVAEGRRGTEDEPIIYQVGATTVSSQLGGSSQIDRTVDRATGWLRSAEQRTSLRGRVLRTTSSTPGQPAFSDVAMAIITTVTAIE